MRRIAKQCQASATSRSAVARGHTGPIETSSGPGRAATRYAGPSRRTPARKTSGRPEPTGFLHLRVCRNETDIVDQFAEPARGRSGNACPCRATSARVGRPVRNAIVRDDATVGDGPPRRPGEKAERPAPKRRVDAVRSNNEIAFRNGPVRRMIRGPGRRPDRRRYSGARVCTTPFRQRRWQGSRRGRRGAFRTWRSSPPESVTCTRCYRRSVVTQVPGARIRPWRQTFRRRGPGSTLLKLADAVRRQEDARTDLAEMQGACS